MPPTKPSTPPDPYQEFFTGQWKREEDWSEATKAKRARVKAKETKSSSDASLANNVTTVKLKLEATESVLY